MASDGVERNKALVRRYFEVMARGSVEEAAAMWAPGTVNHGAGRSSLVGRDLMRTTIEMLQTAFPDRRWEIEDVIAEGDRVVVRMTVSGTFGARPARPPFPLPPGFLGVEGTELVTSSEATGKPYSVQHIHIVRIEDGLIAEHWAARNDLGLLIQLGAIVPPASPSPEAGQPGR